LKMPVYNVPGNHDIFDSLSVRLWKEYLGDSYYSLDYGGFRFIALDTETDRSRISEEQFKWLEKQLAENKVRQVFIFCHKPLFPVDSHVGSSLDEFPLERDRLHQLFVKHKKIIKGIFQGHEHLYNFEKRDGLSYYITGGGGAELYVPPELGGFYHYLLIHVDRGKVGASVKSIRPITNIHKIPQTIYPGKIIDDWRNLHSWYTWKQPVNKEITNELATHGSHGLKLFFDYSLNEWAVLYSALPSSFDLRTYKVISYDVLCLQNLRSII